MFSIIIPSFCFYSDIYLEFKSKRQLKYLLLLWAWLLCYPYNKRFVIVREGMGLGKIGEKDKEWRKKKTHRESKLVPLNWKGTVEFITNPMNLKINKHEMYRKLILEYYYHGNISEGSMLPLEWKHIHIHIYTFTQDFEISASWCPRKLSYPRYKAFIHQHIGFSLKLLTSF